MAPDTVWEAIEALDPIGLTDGFCTVVGIHKYGATVIYNSRLTHLFYLTPPAEGEVLHPDKGYLHNHVRPWDVVKGFEKRSFEEVGPCGEDFLIMRGPLSSYARALLLAQDRSNQLRMVQRINQRQGLKFLDMVSANEHYSNMQPHVVVSHFMHINRRQYLTETFFKNLTEVTK